MRQHRLARPIVADSALRELVRLRQSVLRLEAQPAMAEDAGGLLALLGDMTALRGILVARAAAIQAELGTLQTSITATSAYLRAGRLVAGRKNGERK